ncbi:MAG TPA: alpha/beta fold hydrolase [Streptosporangiaceae bacterium]|nr:alpha/beta fold hydrolase [Streptosporangiaceae bacterium]
MNTDRGDPEPGAGAFEAAEAASALDLLLSDAALGVARRFLPNSSTLRFALGLARRPGTVARRGASLAGELASIAAGRSAIAPGRRDRRFADAAWSGNPLLARVVQAYLAWAGTAESLLADAELDWRDTERMRFVLSNLIDAAAPSNNPLISPEAWKALIDSGGLSVMRGLRSLLSDLSAPPRVPAMVAADAFEVGRDLAVTPGAVVARWDIGELIQFEPVTESVYSCPLLIVPPMINKYYITDLAPGRSMIEYLVGQGHQVYVISWRNPDARHRDWDLDSYGTAITGALAAVRSISRAPQASICALCSGGIASSMVAAQLAATGRLGELATLCLGVTVLDQAQAGTAAAMIDRRTAHLATASSQARGYLDGRALAEVFAWLRPNDLIWNYWVNNYLKGQTPPPFDILYWNADTTRLPAGVHRDFIEIALSNALTKPDEATMLGSPVDLSRVDIDSYVVAGIADHLCPWQSCYRSTRLLGGTTRFVLSTSGHIASMVNPPSNPKATFQAAPDTPADPRDWLRAAQTVPGSWWPDYSSWLAERSGGRQARRPGLGRKGFRPMQPAPGSYVLDR